MITYAAEPYRRRDGSLMGGWLVIARTSLAGSTVGIQRNVSGPYTTKGHAEAKARALTERGSSMDDLPRMYELVETLARQLGSTVELLAQAHTQLHAELAELRDGFVELDHAKAPVARLNELRTRVDLLWPSVSRR